MNTRPREVVVTAHELGDVTAGLTNEGAAVEAEPTFPGCHGPCCWRVRLRWPKPFPPVGAELRKERHTE